MSKINERIILILNMFFNGNVSEMARKTGIAQTTLNNIVANKFNKPSAENIEKLLISMENISAEWLILGSGNMERSAINIGNINNSGSNNNIASNGNVDVKNFTPELEKALLKIEFLEKMLKDKEKIIELLTKN